MKLDNWKDGGVYLLKNDIVAQPVDWDIVKQKVSSKPWVFKVKTVRPILYYCKTESIYHQRVTLTLINPTSQFQNLSLAPRQRLYADFYEGKAPYFNYPDQPWGPEDFIYLGQETSTVNHWGEFTKRRNAEIVTQWEKVAIEKGYFTPATNPSFKSKKEREQETALDFYKQEVKIGDMVAYVRLTGSQRISVGKVTNITHDNFVVKQDHWGFYVAPHSYVIRCPEELQQQLKDQFKK